MENKQLITISYLFMLDMNQIALKKIYKLTNDKLVHFLLDWIEELEYNGYPEYTRKMCDNVKEYILEKYAIDKIIDNIKQNKSINQDIDQELLNLKDKIEIIDDILNEHWTDKNNYECKVEILVKIKILDSTKSFEELTKIKMDMLDNMWKQLEKVKFEYSVSRYLSEPFMDFKVGENTKSDIEEWLYYKGFEMLV